MQYKATLTTANKSKGTNTCQYIVLHHTGTQEGTIKGVLNTLTVGSVSCHYVVDTNGDVYKIGEDKDILWHAGTSAWNGLTDLNKYSIGIEVIGVLKDGGFTDAQRESVGKLVLEIASKYAIPKENFVRHKDIAPGRKVDIADTFWNGKFKTWEDYKTALFAKPAKPMTSKYTEIMNNVLKETGFQPIFQSHEGDKPLTEQETKELIEISLARFFARAAKK